jgi:hypothetical protein
MHPNDFKGFSYLELPITEHVYTFVDKATGEPTHIAATTLRLACEASRLQPILCEIGDTLVDALKAGALGVEEHHALKLQDSALETPLLVCIWGDSHVLADGAHRLWRRWKRGDQSFMAYMVPEPAWRLFTIYDMPGDGSFWDDFNRNAKVRPE